jgi:hypothetical protein
MSVLDPNNRNDDIVETPNAANVRRLIAENLRSQGQRLVYYIPSNRNISYYEALATMLWDGLVEGEVKFADGTILKVSDDPKFWMEMVKFVSSHLDGGVNQSTNFNSLNVFKVYQGVDPDRV